MKYFSVVAVSFMMSFGVVFSQNKVIKHTVKKDETINQIAQKYQVTPYDIYQLNPDASKGVKPGSVLLISKREDTKKESSQSKGKVVMHEVQPKETLYGICKKYGITEAQLKAANPFLETTGVQIGQTLTISNNAVASSNKKTDKKEVGEKYVYHDVLAKETKYSIAKQYGISIQELEKKNPLIVQNLPIGYRLTIKGNAPQNTVSNVNSVNSVVAPTSNLVDYQVKPKETMYSLSKSLGLTQDELIALNPVLSNGLQEGMVLKVPSSVNTVNSISPTIVTQNSNQQEVVLTKKTGVNDRKKVALLLPFNMAKISNDTTFSMQDRLKKDKFLNMTLDFYSGALMAIDSAKTLGLPIDVSIFDSHENKNGSNVSQIIQQNKLQDADAVIGPFYQANAETAANYLRLYNVPVISPLSKDLANPISNLYQAVPTNTTVRNSLFDYIRSKNGNIVAVIDPKKESVLKYMRENQSGVALAKFSEKGSLDQNSVKQLLKPNVVNYIVMETASTWMVKSTINVLLESMKNYQVQLAILEPNATLESDEINFLNLTKLKLTYPSVNRENDSDAAKIFKKEYRKKNNINPNTFATRGFDVTFDTLMRVAQDKTYQETTKTFTTEQVDNKFQYYDTADGGHANKGVYILYYDTDLTIKEAN